MPKVTILIEGYAKKHEDYELASSSTTLIETGGKHVIVDPGMNKVLLLDALEKRHLSPADINFVLLTHSHLDHILLCSLFENAQIFGEKYFHTPDGKIYESEEIFHDLDIDILSTPGHDAADKTFFVETEEYGVVAICGDVFFWTEENEQKTDRKSLLNLPDPYLKDKKVLLESRKKILEIADYIIPGHGKPFAIKK